MGYRRVRLLCVALVAGAVVVACAPNSSEPNPAGSNSEPQPGHTPSQTECGQDYLEDLDQRERLAQLLVVGVENGDDAVQIVHREQIGGIFIGSWTDMSILEQIPRIQDAADRPVMVAIDEEGGRVSRLDGRFGPMPSPRTSAQTMSAGEVRDMARKRGRQMADVGITVDFAPDVDVSDQPANGPIGDRSYSSDADVVTTYATAFARGLQDAGILPVIKHFPGHGHATGDSHTGLITTPPLTDLLEQDLVPYKQMAGMSPLGVMVGHLDVPGLTDAAQPASLSPAAIELLRSGHDGSWPSFDGVVFTDDLSGMQAITDSHPIDEAAKLALAAGNDVALWLTTDEVPDVLDHLTSALQGGDLDAVQIERSVLRVARAKGIIDCDLGTK